MILNTPQMILCMAQVIEYERYELLAFWTCSCGDVHTSDVTMILDKSKDQERYNLTLADVIIDILKNEPPS